MYPALAVVEALGKDVEILWVGSMNGIEVSLVERAGIPFQPIPAAGVHGVGLGALPGNVWSLVKGFIAARGLIGQFKPDVIFFTGGFVGVPTALAGRSIPKVTFTPDIEPGLALKIITRMADLITVSTASSKRFHAGREVLVSGYPTRSALRTMTKSKGREILELPSDQPVLLVFGGSRGAHSINSAFWNEIERVLQLTYVVHITGELDWHKINEVQRSIPPQLTEKYRPYRYLHEKMPAAIAAADLALTRAGASTLGEFTVQGLASILVPYPHAWRYQKTNADYLVSRGAAMVIKDEELADTFYTSLSSLLADPEKLGAMSEAARALAQPDAAQKIASVLRRFEQKAAH